MSTETYNRVPVARYGGKISETDIQDVPRGFATDTRNVQFLPGSVRTRPGANSFFSEAGSGTPRINGLHSYINIDRQKHLVFFTSQGALRTRGANNLTISSILSSDSYLSASSLYNRVYTAYSDGEIPTDYPRFFENNLNDVNGIFEPVAPPGPGAGPAAAESATAGNIVVGNHSVVVWFETDTGYWTRPSPSVTWNQATASRSVDLSNIPVGPSYVRRRLVAFTVLDGESFYHVSTTMVIDDNTTTTLTVDFTDTNLVTAGTLVDSLLRRITLPPQSGVIGYASRLAWWGERNMMQDWSNLGFDGGFISGLPNGWTAGAANAGGSEHGTYAAGDIGQAYRITGDGATAVRGEITQAADVSAFSTDLIERNKAYRVRARVKRSAGLVAGTLHIDLQSTAATIDTAGLQVTAAAAGTGYVEFEAELTPAQTAIPTDLLLRVFADGTPTSGEFFVVDQIEVKPSDARENPSLVRVSGAADPEAYDGVSGFLQVARNDGRGLRAAFELRDLLYLVKERSVHVTKDNGSDTIGGWSLEQVSREVGTPSIHGVASGEEWVVIADVSGLYYFSGGAFIKLSQEIQPEWDGVNWDAGETVWVTADTKEKRLLVGVPFGAAVRPDRIFMMDFNEGFGDPIQNRGVGRKWDTNWTLQANSAVVSDLETGFFRTFLGMNNEGANVRIFELLDSQLSDNGAAIDSYYQMAFVSATGDTIRSHFGYLVLNVKGSGTLVLNRVNQDGSLTALNSLTLAATPNQDLERMLNYSGNRFGLRVGTNASGSFFQLQNATFFVKPDPFALTRGSN